jgi:hypothetical protein
MPSDRPDGHRVVGDMPAGGAQVEAERRRLGVLLDRLDALVGCLGYQKRSQLAAALDDGAARPS